MICSLGAVYFVPHQDDETLSMSISVLRDIAAGVPVYLVLFTNGGDTSARYVVNGYNEVTGKVISSRWWGGTHNPAMEGYKPLTWQEIYDARDQEFRSACGALGVPPHHIYIIRTREHTVNGFKETFRRVIHQLSPDTHYHTMSFLDTHSDHRNGARALWELWREGEITNARFWLSRYDIMTNKTELGNVPSPTTDAEKVKIGQAARCYQAWNPAARSFAVGVQSVPDQWKGLLENPVFRYFGPEDFQS